MRKLFVIGALLALGGCSLAPNVIRAVARDGRILFEIYDPGSWPFGGKIKDIASNSVVVMHDTEVMWEIERSMAPRCQGQARKPTFPLTYSVTPDCFVLKAAPRELRPGVLYRVESDLAHGNSGGGEGFFKIGLTPVNFDLSRTNDELRDWERYRPVAVDENGYAIRGNHAEEADNVTK
ncbi:hypothetical protein [Sphingomonas sp. G-3-2-10]|uniref:hypothetical protein n=1 Tax=Sphingomonas sp. G-3-2-10 TaxID=2728838 RepID=UPI00146B03A8|nr:hypothetical protein [Sphingomonas sp. G-3-2-10]NML06590.1 hypothetical protein [Sphingomonas sp. G-3-2-10]